VPGRAPLPLRGVDRPVLEDQGDEGREKLNKIGRAERSLATELGREPTAEEIAVVTGIDEEEVDRIKHSARAPGLLSRKYRIGG
jgi:DNA-directed RNA polymerase sigma subunit (sigma70/sigma32)